MNVCTKLYGNWSKLLRSCSVWTEPSIEPQNMTSNALTIKTTLWVAGFVASKTVSEWLVCDFAYIVQNSLEAWQDEKRRHLYLTDEQRWGRCGRTRHKDLHMCCQIQESHKKSINCHANWEANEIQTSSRRGRGQKGERTGVFLYMWYLRLSLHAPCTRLCCWLRAKRSVKLYHNSNSSSPGKDKPWHQNGGSGAEDNSSLCGSRAEAWPGWTEGLLSEPAVLSSCLNLCLYLCHTCNFNSAWKLT